MVQELLNCYSYPNKSTITRGVDLTLYPASQLFGKSVQYDPIKKTFSVEEAKCTSIFCKAILFLLMVVILPLTLIVSLFKLCDNQNSNIHQAYMAHCKIPEGSECDICTDSIREKGEKIQKIGTILACHHYFHLKCIIDWFSRDKDKTCPNCRREAPPPPPPGTNDSWYARLSRFVFNEGPNLISAF